MLSSQYIESERREYSLYVLTSRAIPHIADGMKAAARRVLWVARDGKTHKAATLAGATIPIHPHAPPESTINTLAAFYGNNVPLLHGEGAFGTMLKPTAYAAPRYTSVRISQFTKDVVFADIEIVPMMDNFDMSQKEPKHFIPLVPVALLNPQEGIAVGFACNILPRSLKDVIEHQINYLAKGTKPKLAVPTFHPTEQTAQTFIMDRNEKCKWVFHGTFEKSSATLVRVTGLPYGMNHTKYLVKLDNLKESGTVIEYTDNSRDKYNIEVKFKRGILTKLDDDGILKLLDLVTGQSENFNVIDFDGTKVWAPEYHEVIQKYTDWRLDWYIARYKRLAGMLDVDIQRLKDILLAIKKKVGARAPELDSRAELKEFLEAIGIVHLDFIADLAVYRFTEQERLKTQEKLDAALNTMQEYQDLLNSEDLRKQKYIEELKEVRKKIPTYLSGK